MQKPIKNAISQNNIKSESFWENGSIFSNKQTFFVIYKMR